MTAKRAGQEERRQAMERLRLEVELIGPRRVDEVRRIAERDRLVAAAVETTPPRWLGALAAIRRRATDLLRGALRAAPGRLVRRRSVVGESPPAVAHPTGRTG